MASRACFYCDEVATHDCPTCGRLYCAEHGEEACLRCIAPEASVPNAWAYRGSLLALAAGIAVTAYLLISPPQTREAALAARVATPTPTAAATATQIPRPSPAATPAAGSTVAVGSPTAAPTDAATAAPLTYTVAEGDTLSAIAEDFDTTVERLVELNPGLDPDLLSTGQVITLPAGQ